MSFEHEKRIEPLSVHIIMEGTASIIYKDKVL